MTARPDPRYPALSREAAGWLRYMRRKVRIADDWRKGGRPSEAWDARTSPPTLNWHRFDLTFASIAIALMADVTPAWREAYAEILDSLALRMTTYWAWHDWIEQRGEDPARGAYPPAYLQLLIPPGLAGRYNVPGWAGNGLAPHPYEPDPVATRGALYYKGFFHAVLGLYEYVSGGDRYDRPFELVYDDRIRFTYDHRAIAETLARQWRETPPGIHCEVRKIWPMCTLLAGLGSRLYDLTHGADLHAAFLGWYDYARRHYLSPVRDHPPEWLTLYYDPDVGVNLKTQDARAWLLTTYFLVPHDEALARLLWQGARHRFLVEHDADLAYFTSVSGCPGDDALSTGLGLSVAHELGDDGLAARLRAWVDRHYQPTFDGDAGEFYFRFRLTDVFPRGQYNGLTMPSVVGRAGAWWRLFNRPNLDKLREPTLRGVDGDALGVSQAFYDRAAAELVVATYPARADREGNETTVRVSPVDDSGRYTVTVDGEAHRRWTTSGTEMVITLPVGDHLLRVARSA